MSGVQSIYLLTSRALGQQNAMDATSSNVANANTHGYRRQEVDFQELIGGTPARPAGRFTQDMGFRSNFEQGGMDPTGNPLDLALNGEGMFGIEVDGEVQYTRNGQFNIDVNGALVTGDGMPVLNVGGGEIVLPTDATNINITADGTITADGELVDQVGVYEFPENAALIRIGENRFINANNDVEEAQPGTAQVLQGMLETSNVNSVMETVKMTEILRSYQSTQRIIQNIEELEQRAIREIPARAQ